MCIGFCSRFLPTCSQKEQISIIGALGTILVIFMVTNFRDTERTVRTPMPVFDQGYAKSIHADGVTIIPSQPAPRKEKPEKKPEEKKLKDEIKLEEEQEEESDEYAEFPSQISVRLWIDVPNAFPWRKCLHEYNRKVFTYGCSFSLHEAKQQALLLSPLPGSSTRFLLSLEANRALCLEEDQGQAVFRTCSQPTFWRWTRDALLEWSGGGCLASTGGQAGTVVVPCNSTFDDQIVEVGVVSQIDNENQLLPFDLPFWEGRMERTRDQEIALAKVEVDRVLAEIKQQNSTGDFERKVVGSRRAVVFYVDKGSGFLAYLTWWMFTWRTIGLDSEKEAFDIILMTHPLSVAKLPADCLPVPEDFDPLEAPGPGRCLWKEMVPLSERDHRYDNYLNSQECLFNPAAAFLLRYRLLIRADLDTFPTPAMVGYWPTDVICNRNAGTTHYRADIEGAIIETARAAGIEHHKWHNTDSAWMGPAGRVVALSKLTTYLARFTRAHMFGPGTVCRCASCHQLPKSCEWGSGIYAGTLLLYAQEIAMNHLWTQREYDEQTYAILDGSCTDGGIHVCQPALLHARHNSEPFSKFSFLGNKYKDQDMSGLNITNVRDYAMYMALSSKKQGKGGAVAWARYTKAEKPMAELCKGAVVGKDGVTWPT